MKLIGFLKSHIQKFSEKQTIIFFYNEILKHNDNNDNDNNTSPNTSNFH